MGKGSLVYIHYSKDPLEEVYDTPEQDVSSKPNGLWISVDNAWEQWCLGEDWNIDSFKFENLITLDTRDLLFLTTEWKLLEFTQMYGRLHYIDWERVAKIYKGIVITPYQWGCRLDQKTMWYYGWDVASGCIWDKNAIIDVRTNAI